MTLIIIIAVVLLVAYRLRYVAKIRDENDQIYERELMINKGTI